MCNETKRRTPGEMTARFRERLEDTAGEGSAQTGVSHRRLLPTLACAGRQPSTLSASSAGVSRLLFMLQVLFLGDSDIEYWDVDAGFPRLRLQRCGVGGARMSDIAAFAPTAMSVFTGLDAIVVVAGEIDMAFGATATDAYASFEAFLAAVRAVNADVPVLYIRCKPESSTKKLHSEYEVYDGLVEELCTTDMHLQVRFLATFPRFCVTFPPTIPSLPLTFRSPCFVLTLPTFRHADGRDLRRLPALSLPTG